MDIRKSKGTMAPEVQRELFYEKYSDKEIEAMVYAVWYKDWIFNGEDEVPELLIDQNAVESLIQYIKELRDNG